MTLKIGKVKIKLHFLFFGLLSYMLSDTMFRNYLTALIYAALHESAHIAAMIHFGCPIVDITAGIFGMRINRSEDTRISLNNEIFIASAGLAVNLLFSAVYSLLYIKLKNDFVYTSLVLNLGLFIMNILPLKCLDGGRIIYYTVWNYMSMEKAEKVISVCGIITVCFILVCTVLAKTNITLYIACVYTVILYISSLIECNYP